LVGGKTNTNHGRQKKCFYFWKLLLSLHANLLPTLMRYFETKFLDEAEKFISRFEIKTIKKILYNIDLAEQTNDPRLFKKLQQDIWEFRTNFEGLQIRLLAFWDKTDNKATLVIATHGFIKKVDKVAANEIDRAVGLKNKYFRNKAKK
jgi:phage-related protein